MVTNKSLAWDGVNLVAGRGAVEPFEAADSGIIVRSFGSVLKDGGMRIFKLNRDRLQGAGPSRRERLLLEEASGRIDVHRRGIEHDLVRIVFTLGGHPSQRQVHR